MFVGLSTAADFAISSSRTCDANSPSAVAFCWSMIEIFIRCFPVSSFDLIKIPELSGS